MELLTMKLTSISLIQKTEIELMKKEKINKDFQITNEKGLYFKFTVYNN